MMLAMILRPAPDVGQHDADKASPAALAKTSQEGIAAEGSDIDSLESEAAGAQPETTADGESLDADGENSDSEAGETKETSESQTASDSSIY